MPLEPEYPPGRFRLEEAPEFEGVYDRQDGGNISVGAGLTVRFTFSGVPDSIDLIAQNGFLNVTFNDQNNIPLGPQVAVAPNTPYITQLAARSIDINNATGGALTMTVVGKWLRPRPLIPRYAEAGAPE